MLPQAVAACVLAVCAAVSECVAGPLDVSGKPAESAVVVAAMDGAAPGPSRSPMLDRLDGVIAELDRKEIAELRASIVARAAEPLPLDAVRVATIQLRSGAGARTTHLWRDRAGGYLLPDGEGPADAATRAVRLDGLRAAVIVSAWPAYRGDWKARADDPKPGEVTPLARPVHGWFVVDDAMIDSRFFRGRKHQIPGAVRKLADESFFVRLPKGFEPGLAWGVLIWIHAGPEGQPPATLFEAADALGLIIVSAANSGNDRLVAERYQLALDGLATVSERWLTDPERVYVCGISGGGKVASHLWLGVPEVVKGAVPIVGLSRYENVSAGPGKAWAADVGKPSGKLLRLVMPHRCAAMTGPKDGNYDAIIGAADMYIKDKLAVRVFDDPEMGHHMPTAAQFTEAMSWVDEPARSKRAAEAAAAAEMLSKADSEEQLIAVTRAAPWSKPAWEAVQRLSRRGAPGTP